MDMMHLEPNKKPPRQDLLRNLISVVEKFTGDSEMFFDNNELFSATFHFSSNNDHKD